MQSTLCNFNYKYVLKVENLCCKTRLCEFSFFLDDSPNRNLRIFYSPCLTLIGRAFSLVARARKTTSAPGENEQTNESNEIAACLTRRRRPVVEWTADLLYWLSRFSRVKSPPNDFHAFILFRGIDSRECKSHA